MNCIYCNENCIKRGKSGLVQRYQCKSCKKSQQAHYSKPRIPQEKYDWTVKLSNEGCGISNIARLLEISKSSVQRLISKGIHKIYSRCTNYIERKNLTLRTLLKRLARKTLCFTRTAEMLENVVFLLVFKPKMAWCF